MNNLRNRLANLESKIPARVTAKPQTEPADSQVVARFDAFFSAVSPQQERKVFDALFPFASDKPDMPHHGLSLWFLEVAAGKAFCPSRIPPEVMTIYLDDPAAQPRNECAACGLRLPIRPGRQGGPAMVNYFSTCPVCGGKVQWYYEHGNRHNARKV